MAKAIWNGTVIADSDDIALVEGNAYFPVSSIKEGVLSDSSQTTPTFCHWKGIAEYYDISVDGETNEGAAWFYDKPYPASSVIKDRIAFWKGVEVTGAPDGTGLVELLPSQRDGRTRWEALCWLMRHGDQEAYTEEEITANTDLTPEDLPDAWAHNDVERFACRYEWTLEGGNGAPYTLVSTGPGPYAK